MTKIACLLPNFDMIELVQKVIDEMKYTNITYLKCVQTGLAVEYAQEALNNGAEIIVTRGLQASYIKRTTSVPVVEMMMTGQEMGLLITKAKQMLQKEHPVIAVVGYSNMFCNMDYFEQIYDVQIRSYYIKNSLTGVETLKERVCQAIEDQVDFIIGGDLAVQMAREAGVPSLFVTATEDSVREALIVAQRVAYASDREKENTAELKTLLDNSFGVVIKLDREGKVVIINHVAENLLDWQASEVIGKSIETLTDAFDSSALQSVLAEGKEIYSEYICINRVSMVASLSPILVEGEITGAIFSSQEVKQLEEMGVAARRELYNQGFVAKATFDLFEEPSHGIRKTVELAQLYAQSDAPVLIYSEPGNGQELFAQSIHNAGKLRAGPYVSVGCAQMASSEQTALLFGTPEPNGAKGLLATAHKGTAYLSDIEFLSRESQYRLLRLINDHVIFGGGGQRPLPANIRIIASCGDQLLHMVENGTYSEELFYALNNLHLEIPPLRDRPEDIRYHASRFIKLFGEKYKRYITLTTKAMQKIEDYGWNGNRIQLSSFCERIVLTAPRRSVDENFIETMYFHMYPLTHRRKTEQPSIVYKDPEAAVIAELLEKYNGCRGDVANALGISTTTLWRKIKKYNIANKYEL
ncbi:MAG: PrpR N-terminal domain-containing protein [Oscillospiraceae bacterium]